MNEKKTELKRVIKDQYHIYLSDMLMIAADLGTPEEIEGAWVDESIERAKTVNKK